AHVGPCDTEDEDAAVAGPFDEDEFFEMFPAAFGDGVGESRATGADEQSDVLHFDEGSPLVSFEEKIDPTSGPVLDLAAQDPIAGELGDSAVLNRFGDERIGARGVYVDARAGTFGHFPGVEELAPRARF